MPHVRTHISGGRKLRGARCCCWRNHTHNTPVDGHVEAHELVEVLVLVAQHAAEVAREVERLVLGHHAVKVLGAVDDGGNLGHLGDHVEHVLVRVLPVGGLVGPGRVGRRELAARLAGRHADGEGRHGVHVLGEGPQEGLHVGGQLAAGVQLGGEGGRLLHGGDLAREQEPDEALGDGLARARLAALLAREGGEELLALGDGVAPEADTLVRVQERGLVQHALDPAPAADALVHRELAQRLGAVLGLKLLHLLLLDGHQPGQHLLERL